MTKHEAKYIARRYEAHCVSLTLARASRDKRKMEFHTGCMKMSLQIFERFNESHGYGSPAHALSDDKHND